MRSESYRKRLFVVGAVWNWSVALLLTALAVLFVDVLMKNPA